MMNHISIILSSIHTEDIAPPTGDKEGKEGFVQWTLLLAENLLLFHMRIEVIKGT